VLEKVLSKAAKQNDFLQIHYSIVNVLV